MKNFLTIFVFLWAMTALAQSSELNVDRLVSGKSFVFVSTASFSDQPIIADWQPIFGPTPMSISKMQNLEKNAGLDRALMLNQYIDASSKPAADKMAKSKSNEVDLLYLHTEEVLFHPSLFQPAFYELIGRNPDNLNDPFAFDKYSAQKNKKGKWTINFTIEDDLYRRSVLMLVSPDGKTEMTIATAVKRYNSAARTKQYFKGFIKGFESI